MTETIRKRLSNPQQAHAAITAAYQVLKPYLMAEHCFELTIKPSTRTPSQSNKFHAICEDVAKSGTLFRGKPRTKLGWKVLFISGHSIATGEGADIIPGLEDEFVNIRESSAGMSIPRGSSLIEYTLAWCAQNSVRLSAPEYA